MLTPALFQIRDFQLRPVQFALQIRNARLWIEGRNRGDARYYANSL